jgi:hypothetical protein
MREVPRPDERDEELQVAGALRQLAAETRPPHPLPTAGQLWWRAEVIRRLVEKPDQAAGRELRPARWGEVTGITFALVMLLGFFSLQAPAVLEPLWQRMVLGGPRTVAILGLVPLVATSLMGLLLARRN